MYPPRHAFPTLASAAQGDTEAVILAGVAAHALQSLKDHHCLKSDFSPHEKDMSLPEAFTLDVLPLLAEAVKKVRGLR